MRGYFGIGVEGISKPMNVGAVLRTAHAFGAGFVFTIAPVAEEVDFGWSNTSDAAANLPLRSPRTECYLSALFPDVDSKTGKSGAVSIPF